ncbi:DUF1289 domain-containing protein [Saccharospirillum impatiens]|uniref:DUF1289 domain-containing protein n=1 Tax=Saccharospirillum impatiens TaxID=169438 RepID=UPI000402C8A5|nr:DUF1289 domain-containing protein [Saccharospirillum impatiens]
MKQLEFFDIPSPCIGVCESGARGYCRGCFRSRAERQYWFQADDEAKRLIIRACQVRKLRFERTQNGQVSDPEPQQETLALISDEGLGSTDT